VRFVATILVLALGLAACGRKPEPPAQAPATGGLPAMGDFLGPMAAVGTEPFWRADIQPGGQISLTRPAQGQAPVGAPYAPPRAVAGGAAFTAGPLKIQFTPGPCSDGMSDVAYPYTATVTAPDGVTLKGCGYGKWSAGLTGLIPAIDACMAQSGGRYAVIWAASDGDGARVRFDDGEPRECAFKVGKASFADTNGAPMPSERDPLFVRGPKREVVGECGLSDDEEVLDVDGEVIGWLTSDDEC
jgi:uncharacterized membrane protein